MENGEWISQRKLAELKRKERVELFDKFIDYALDGVVELDQAILGYQETCATEGILLDNRQPA